MEDKEWIDNNVAEVVDNEDGDFEGTVFLSTDGKQTVSVKASTKLGRKAALIWAKAVYDKLMYSYGSRQKFAAKEYKEADDTGVKCDTCGMPAVSKSGEKNGRKWSGIFCSSDNKAHTKWI